MPSLDNGLKTSVVHASNKSENNAEIIADTTKEEKFKRKEYNNRKLYPRDTTGQLEYALEVDLESGKDAHNSVH